MEIYGAGYGDDVDYFRYTRRNTETHKETMVKQLERLIQGYTLAIQIIERHSSAKANIATPMFKSQFLCLLYF